MLGAMLGVMRSPHDTNDSTTTPGTPIIVPLESRRRERAQLAQKLQHVLPSVLLLSDGLGRFGGERAAWSLALGVAEVVTSALVIGAFARAVRRVMLSSNSARHEQHVPHGVDWVDVFLGGMLVTEALVHRQETGHLPRPTILLAVVLVVIGLLHGRLRERNQRRRELRLTDEGISISRRWRRRFNATWPEIDAIELAPRVARIVMRSGAVREIDLADAKNAPAIVEVLAVARDRLTRYNLQLQAVAGVALNGR
jgi:hypothetical protein